MADIPEPPEGYQAIPEDEQKKANVFFDRGKSVADTGQYEYAIEMYLQGLRIDPENTDAHHALREISLKRKASGGKDMKMSDKWALKTNTSDDRQNMLAAEKLLAYDPGNTERMSQILQSAHRAGYFDTVMWIGAILFRANRDSKKPDYNKYMVLKDVYKAIDRYKEAVEVCHAMLQIRPSDMELLTEAKNLGAQLTMSKGGYLTGKSFRDSIKDMEGQKKLLDADKDVRTTDSLLRAVQDTEAEWQADPQEPTKLKKLVDALVRTEREDMEARAVQLLDDAHRNTGQFRWRLNRGQLRLAQLTRKERALKAELKKDPDNEELKQQYQEFAQNRLKEEFDELTLWVENYPTDSNYRFALADRLFRMGRYDEAIPVFQHVRNDPKYRIEATIALGRAFFESGYLDEAADTLRGVIEDYPIKGDNKSKDLYYWYARSLEQKGTIPEAIKAYSQVAMWDFNFRDVQTRIKRLRAGPTVAG